MIPPSRVCPQSLVLPILSSKEAFNQGASSDSRVRRSRNPAVPDARDRAELAQLHKDGPPGCGSTNLKDEPIHPPKNSAHLVEPRPLQHACVSICINENLVDCP